MKKIIVFLLLVVCCSAQANIPAWTIGSALDVTAQVDSKQLDQQSYTKTSSRKITEKNGFIEQSASNSSLSGKNIKLNATK